VSNIDSILKSEMINIEIINKGIKDDKIAKRKRIAKTPHPLIL